MSFDADGRIGVLEDPARVTRVSGSEPSLDLDGIVDALRSDLVVLVEGIRSKEAQAAIMGVAKKLGLHDSLELQAAFAARLGHRERVGQYFMTVNKRHDYQFIPPHSEGSSFTNIQLGSFYCYENSTDGGETVLMNVDSSSVAWNLLRERVVRGTLSGRITTGQIAHARAMYRLNLPDDTLKAEDEVLQERECALPGLRVFTVLARPKTTYSCILRQESYAYWDTISSIDLDAARPYRELLCQRGLLREPSGGLRLCDVDPICNGRIRHSGAAFTEIFRCSVTRKLTSGDLIIYNNLTWAHSAANWSPGSGTRTVAAAFA